MGDDAGTVGDGPRLFGVLVTYRRPDALARFLDVLSEQRRAVDHLIVVDNAPTDANRATVEGHETSAARRDYLAMAENTGPAGGFAAGMQRALDVGRPADWVVLLDDDNPPKDDDLLDRLLTFAVERQRTAPPVGLVGKTGARFDLRRGRTVRPADEELRGAVEVDYVASGQFPLISLAAAAAVGVHNPELFFSFEDLDFGLRLRASGYAVVLHGDLAHAARAGAGRLGGDFGRRSLTRSAAPWRRYYSTRNLVWLLRDRHRTTAALAVSATALGKTVVLAARDRPEASAHLRLGCRAVADGWRGRLGRTVLPTSYGP
jgi:GT2 family glycosyltransferase